MSLRPSLRRLLAPALAAAAAMLAPAAAHAAGTPFSQANPEVLIAQGGPTQLNSAVESNGQLVFNALGTPSATYNAIALDPNNGFLYGMTTATAGGINANEVVQIDSTGAVTDTGTASTLGSSTKVNDGVWDPANNEMYFLSSTSASTSMMVYNPATNQVVSTITLNSAPLAYDLTYAQGSFWGLYWNASMSAPAMEQVTPAGVVTNYTNVPTSLAPGLGNTNGMNGNPVAGAAWTYGNGNLGFSANDTGEIYQIAVNTSGSTPTFSLVSSQPGPANSQNDGANIKGAATTMSISAPNPAPTAPGATATWTYTIANNGTANSSGFSFSDTLPSGLTNISVSPSNCTLNGSTVACQGNPQGGGATTTVVVSATVPSTFNAPLSNTATIVPNEASTSSSTLSSTTTLSPAPPALTVQNTSNASATPGSGLTFTVTPTVGSSGGYEGQPITATDTLSTGLMLSAPASGSGWTCSGAAGASTATCTYTPSSAIAPGTALPAITVPTVIAPGQRGSVTATAVVSSSDNSSSQSASTSSDQVSLTPSVDDSVMVAAPSSASEGTAATWTVTVANAGPSTANNVVATVPVPSGTTYTGGPSGCSLGGSTVTCTLTSLGPSSSQPFALQFTPTAPGSLAVSASVTQTEMDSNTANNSGTSPSVTVPHSADLAVSTSGNASANPGTSVTETFTVKDNGPDSSTGFAFSDPLPSGVTGATSPTSGCSVSSGTLSCTEGALASGATSAITVTFTTPATFTSAIQNTGTVSATGTDTDPTSSNNAATITTSPAGPLLSLTDAASAQATPGSATTFTLTGKVSSTAPGESRPITITQTLSSGTTVSASPSGTGWNCSATTVGSSQVSCTLSPTSTIASGTTLAAISVPATIAAGARGTTTSTALIASGDNANAQAASSAQSSTTLTPSVNDSVTVTPPSTASLNTPIVYAVKASNGGPSTANAVNVSVPVPSGATYVSGSSSSSCTLSGSTVTCVQSSIAPGSSTTFNVAFQTATAGSLQVTATVTQTETNSNASNSGSGTATVAQNSDLSVSAQSASANPGTPVTDTFTVTNLGPDPSNGYTLRAPLPSGVTNPTTSTAGCTISSGVFSCTENAALAVNATSTVALTFTTPSTFTSPVATTATVTGANADPASGDNAVTDTTSPAGPLLSVAVAAPGGGVTPGATATYTLTGSVSASAPAESDAVTITDALPSGVTVAATPTGTGWNCAGTTVGSSSVSCVYTPNPSIASGASLPGLSVPVSIPPTSRGTLATTATINSTDNANSAASSRTANTATLTPSVADALTVTAPSSASLDTPAVYAISVSDSGPSTATSVVVTVPVPSGATFVAGSSSSSCSVSGSTVTCAVGTVAPNAAPTVSVAFSTQTTGPLRVAASVTQAETNSAPGAGSSSASATVAQNSDLALTATGTASALPGGQITDTFTIADDGPDPANGFTLSDPLPSGVTGASTSSAGCSISSGAFTCTEGALANGATTSVAVTFAAPSATTSLVNAATVTASNPDPVSADDSASATTAVAPQVSDTVTVTAPASATVGTPATVTVTAANAGPSPATGVVVTVPVPAGATYTSGPGSCSESGSSVVCAVGTLAAGATDQLPLVFTPTQAGTLTVGATISQNEPNAASGDGAGSASAPVAAAPAPAPAASLAVAVTAPSSASTVGAPVVFTIRATNEGRVADPGVVVSMPIPAGTTVSSLPHGCSVSGQTIRCAIGTLAPGASDSLQVALVPSVSGTVSLTASAQGTLPNSDPTRARATSSTPVGHAAAGASRWLRVHIAARRLIRFGTKTRIVATVSDTSAAPASRVTLSLRLPARTVLRHRVRGCTVHGRAMSCRIGALRGHGRVRRTLFVRLRHRGYQRPSAVARGRRYNLPAVARTRTRVFVWVRAHLSLHVFFPGSTLAVGRPERIKFSVRVTNHVTAPDVLVCDSLPSAARVMSAPGLRVHGRQVCATVALLGSHAAFYSVLVRLPAGYTPRKVQDTAFASGATVRRVTVARSVQAG